MSTCSVTALTLHYAEFPLNSGTKKDRVENLESLGVRADDFIEKKNVLKHTHIV